MCLSSCLFGESYSFMFVGLRACLCSAFGHTQRVALRAHVHYCRTFLGGVFCAALGASYFVEASVALVVLKCCSATQLDPAKLPQ